MLKEVRSQYLLGALPLLLTLACGGEMAMEGPSPRPAAPTDPVIEVRPPRTPFQVVETYPDEGMTHVPRTLRKIVVTFTHYLEYDSPIEATITPYVTGVTATIHGLTVEISLGGELDQNTTYSWKVVNILSSQSDEKIAAVAGSFTTKKPSDDELCAGFRPGQRVKDRTSGTDRTFFCACQDPRRDDNFWLLAQVVEQDGMRACYLIAHTAVGDTPTFRYQVTPTLYRDWVGHESFWAVARSYVVGTTVSRFPDPKPTHCY